MSAESHDETGGDLKIEDVTGESSCVRTDDWAQIVLQNLKHRNKVQVDPFSAIYQSNTKLWYEHARLQSLLKDTKHQFATVQHETSELFKSLGTDSSATAVDKLKLKLAQIQIDLREKGNLESNESKIKIDLSKKVRDQGKLIADQSEELKMAKGELSAAHEMMTFLTEEARIEKKSCIAVKDEVENLRKLLSNLEQENSNLIERILIEKSKTAQAMNDMMNSTEATQRTVVGVDGKSCQGGAESRPKGTLQPSQFLLSSQAEKKKPLTMSPVNVLQCHTSEINDISVNSNGGFFVTAGSDCAVKLYELSTGRFLMDFNNGSRNCPVICVDISRGQGKDDQWAVGGGSDGSYRVWNMHTGALRLHATGHAGKIYSCSILGNGSSRLVTCSADRSIKLWDISRSQADALNVMKSASSPLSITATPDRSTLTSGHQDGSLRFWDYLRSSQCTHTVTKLHTAHITNVQYSPRNSHDILTLSKDNTLCILDTRNYTAVKASYSPDGRYVAAGSTDGRVYIWDVFIEDSDSALTPCTVLQGPSPAGPITAVNWHSPQGDLVSSDKLGQCTVWK